MTIAEDMVPGETYVGTADGPSQLDGVSFTVLAMASFHPEATLSVPFEDEDCGTLIAVQFDAWGYPFPDLAIFAPGDWVTRLHDKTPCERGLHVGKGGQPCEECRYIIPKGV